MFTYDDGNPERRDTKKQRVCSVHSPAAFTACLTLGTMVYAAGYSYITGVMRTLERRFNLSSTEVNALMSIMDLTVCILALVVGFLGSSFNKSRMLGFLLLFVAVAQIVSLVDLTFTLDGEKDTREKI